VIEATLRNMAPRPIVSITTANWGWPMTRRSTVASSAAPKSPTMTMASAKAAQ
jgi:hypothetical protein